MSDRIMAPLWLKYPNIPEGSIGWRMGYGESYSSEFFSWYYKLSDDKKVEYNKKFPKPICWDLSEYNIKRHNKFWMYNWKDAKKYSINLLLEEKVHKEKVFFWGNTPSNKNKVGKECLSQWYMADFDVGHITYCCMEQYLMSKKALLFDDEETNNKIMASKNQKEIKQLGREVKNFDSDVWNDFKIIIALTGNYYKFSEISDLREYLLSTEDKILVEASPYDTIWGIGMDKNEAESCDIQEWKGENILGFVLMNVRDEIARLRKFEAEINELC